MKRNYEVFGKAVLITGAARGIGAALAKRLHARGARIALVGLEPEALDTLAKELGSRAAWFEADVSDMAAMKAAVDGAVARFGGIDIVVANAGIYQVAAMADTSPHKFERTLGVNLFGVWNTLHTTLPHVIARRGYVLTISSMAALTHGPLMGAYAASKAAVEAMTDSLRVEMQPQGVGVGCAYFGVIDTDLTRGGMKHPATMALETLAPDFLRKAASVDDAIDVIEQGIRQRSARIWAPRWLGAFLVLRGVAQPLVEWRVRGSQPLLQALALASASMPDESAHELLGVSANVLTPSSAKRR